MSTHFSFIEFLMEQIRALGVVSYKKMFGEYMIYLNAKPIFLICNDTLYVKSIPQTQPFLTEAKLTVPYDGSRQSYFIVEDTEDGALLCDLARVLEQVIDVTKPRKRKID